MQIFWLPFNVVFHPGEYFFVLFYFFSRWVNELIVKFALLPF